VKNDDSEKLSSLYHTLRAPRRRWAIRLLVQVEEPLVSVRSLAREITAVENDVPPNQATGEPYRNVYNALSQTHLPTLAEAGLVIYDPKRQTISRGPNFGTALLLMSINETALKSLQESYPTRPDEFY